MKKIILSLCLIAIYSIAYTQNTYYITGGTQLVSSGGVNLVFSSGTITNDGVIRYQSPSTVAFAGAVNYGGSGIANAYNLNTNSTGGTTVFNSLFSVFNTANLNSGNVNANNKLYVRSDNNANANVIIEGVVTNNIQGLIPTATVTSGGCPSYNSTISLNVSGSVVNYQWQSSPDNTTWSDVSGATNATLNATVTAVRYYRCRLTTTNSSFDEFTESLLLNFSGSGTTSITTTSICPSQLPYSWNGSRASAGTYTYTTTNSQGCDSTATLNLSVKTNHTITATAGSNGSISSVGITNVCSGNNQTYNITANSGYSIADVVVNGSSIGAVSSYTFNNVTANNTISVTFSANCIATTSSTTQTACVSYTWSGTTYTASGSYIKHYTNSCGLDSAATLNLTINNATTSSTTASVCSNQLPYTWNGLTFTTAGSKTKTGLVNSKGCDSSATLTLSVSTSSPATINIAASSSNVCAGTIVTFTATSTNEGTAPTYQWKVNGINVGFNSNTYQTSALNDKDSVWCILTSNSTCATTTTATSTKIKMTIKANPGIGVSSTIGVICTIGGTTNVLNTNTSNGGVWSSDNTAIATVTTSAGANGIVKGVSNGTATLTYTKTNPNGCSLSASTIVIVAAVAAPTAIAGAANLCVGQSVPLSSSPTGGVWSSLTNRASINATTGVITGNNAGTASIQYKVTNIYNCSNTASASIPINATPSVQSITYATGTPNPQNGAGTGNWCANRNFTVMCLPTGGVWSSTGVFTVNATTGVASTGATPGAASVTYTVTSNGCSSSRTITGNVVGCSPRSSQPSTDDSRPLAVDFTVYPNPARSFVSLNVNSLIGGCSIVITDLYGKELKKQIINNQYTTINIQDLSKGFYLISIITTEGKTTKKLVVE